MQRTDCLRLVTINPVKYESNQQGEKEIHAILVRVNIFQFLKST